jgi:hypothetical protein
MSKIYRRPMFRGGGKVSSYGNGIATGLADGGRPGYNTGGDIMRRIREANTGFFGGDNTGQNRTLFGFDIPGTGASGQRYPLPEGNFAEDAIMLTGPGKFIKGGGGGLNLIKSFSKANKFPAGYPKRGLKETGGYNLDTLTGNNKFLSNQYFKDAISPYISGAKEILKPVGSAIKEYGTVGAIGTGAGLYGLSSIYDAWKERQTPEKKEEIDDKEKKLSPEQIEINRLKELLDNERLKKRNELNKKDTDDEKLAKIEKNTKFFEKALDVKGSQIEEASNMALSFAGKALKEGATVKSAFSDFFEEEGKRPSSTRKVKQAAAQAAIQAYLTGEMSEQKFNDSIKLNNITTKNTLALKEAALDPANMDWNKRRTYYMTALKDNTRGTEEVIKYALEDEPGNKSVVFTDDKEIVQPEIAATKQDGFYVLTTENGKRVFEIISGVIKDRSSDYPL